MCNNVTKAVEAIRKLESSDQINQIIDAIKLQQTYVARNAARSVQVGSVVTFEGRRGRVTGEVLKVNQKTIVVLDQSTQQRWKVGASMVSAI